MPQGSRKYGYGVASKETCFIPPLPNFQRFCWKRCDRVTCFWDFEIREFVGPKKVSSLEQSNHLWFNQLRGSAQVHSRAMFLVLHNIRRVIANERDRCDIVVFMLVIAQLQWDCPKRGLWFVEKSLLMKMT